MAMSMPSERTYIAPEFKLSVDEPIRIPDPRTMKTEDLEGIFDKIHDLPIEDLVSIQENTYRVLDRMDEILLDGGKIPTQQIDEIICGVAVLDSILTHKIKGLSKEAFEELDARL